MAGAKDRLIIAGGGLAGCLAALALAKLRPEVDFLLLESGQSFGGNHTWSFFDPDIAADDRWLIHPLVTAHWPAYDIAFPARRRTIDTGYNSASSDRLDRTVRETIGPDRYRLGCEIESLGAHHVRLASGETIDAVGVIDARGPANVPGLDLGWQKFVGREYRFDRPHGLDRPIVMDATVDQSDGYRFVYCLPFSATRMLVEDTYYSLSPVLEVERLHERIGEYVEEKGWGRGELEREETGVLPVVMGGSVESLWRDLPEVPKLGLRGGFFHPTTGYSLPDAVRLAILLSRQPDFRTEALGAILKREAQNLWRERGFYRLLDRMLFRAAPPAERYRVLEHFYRLDADVVARFYAGRSTLADKARILSGRPPVAIGPALAALVRVERQSA